MAEKKSKATEPVELPPRIHINEFLMGHSSLDTLQKAGFKTVVRKEWMRLEEWKEQLDVYLGKEKE